MPGVKKYDVFVLGGGAGGYAAAIRCAMAGLRVACVEHRLDPRGEPVLGSSCLNVGCVPSKTLLDSSSLYKNALLRHGPDQVQQPGLDLGQVMGKKNELMREMGRGVADLFREYGVQWLSGHGRLLPDRRVEVSLLGERAGEQEQVDAEHLVIATGSKSAGLPEIPVNNDPRIVHSLGALSFESVPECLGIIGAGVVGLELGSAWNQLGSRVVLFEILPKLLPTADESIGPVAAKLLRKQGLYFLMEARVLAAESSGEHIAVTYEQRGQRELLEFDRLVVAAGRRPNTEDLGLEQCGIAVDEQGYIQVDELCRTTLPGVYALGDVVSGPRLTHKAFEQGLMVADLVTGRRCYPVDYDKIPWVIFSCPEIASIGINQQQAEARAHRCRSGRAFFTADGRAQGPEAGPEAAEGFVKILSDADNDLLLGVHAIGPQVSELVAEIVLALEFGSRTGDLAHVVKTHPVFCEALQQAARDLHGENSSS